MDDLIFEKKIEQFSQDGILVLSGLYSESEIHQHNELMLQLRDSINDKKDPNGLGDRIGQAHQKTEQLMALSANPTLIRFLSRILGDDPVLFGSLNFEKGTEQRVHVDAMYFWPEPFFSMAGVWIALEDVDENNGPLFYISESHKLDMLMGQEIALDKPDLLAARNKARNGLLSPEEKSRLAASLGNEWTEKYLVLLEKKGLEAVPVPIKKGDVVIWHSLLGHGGMKIKDKNRSRKSVVYHYFGQKTKLFSFENFMLLDKGEFTEPHAEKIIYENYKNLCYMRFPYFVSYLDGQQVVHDLKDIPQKPLSPNTPIVSTPKKWLNRIIKWKD